MAAATIWMAGTISETAISWPTVTILASATRKTAGTILATTTIGTTSTSLATATIWMALMRLLQFCRQQQLHQKVSPISTVRL